MSRSALAKTSLVLLSLGTFALPLQAAPISPFTAMAGSWSGGGTLTTTDGMQEQLRCRANYNAPGAGTELRLSLRCASQSYTFDLASNVEYHGGSISGSWTEATRNASGTISGRAAGEHIDAAAHGNNFAANLSLTTRGGRQTVSIRPQQSNVAAVSLALARH